MNHGADEVDRKGAARPATTLGGGWALKFSNILDYTSEPPPATEDLDLLWLLGVTYTFG